MRPIVSYYTKFAHVTAPDVPQLILEGSIPILSHDDQHGLNVQSVEAFFRSTRANQSFAPNVIIQDSFHTADPPTIVVKILQFSLNVRSYTCSQKLQAFANPLNIADSHGFLLIEGSVFIHHRPYLIFMASLGLLDLLLLQFLSPLSFILNGLLDWMSDWIPLN